MIQVVAGSTPPATNEGWQTLAGARIRAVEPAGADRAGFTLLSPESTSVTFSNLLSDRSIAINRILENGSGVALGDVDGDGWCDLYFCRMEGPNSLYRNLGGWRFEDVTEQSGAACDGQFSTGAALADLDGDGDLDLLVNCVGGGTRSFENDGQGRFTEITDTRLVRRFGSTSLALGDIDGDGDLDLYVANYRTNNYLDDVSGLRVEARRVNGQIVITPEDRFLALMPGPGGVQAVERGDRDVLYLNDGRGRFAPVSWTQGAFLDEDGRPLAGPPTDWVLSVIMHDMNRDGHPDIYTCADFFYWPDRFWLNDAGGRFRAIDRLALRKMSVSSMSADVADLNRDGFDDLFVADMVSQRHENRHWQRPDMMQGIVEQPVERPEYRPEVAQNTLFINRGDGTYTEMAFQAGVAWSEWTWSAVFMDVDLDGYEDLLAANGNNHDMQDADVVWELRRLREPRSVENNLKNLRKFPRLETPNVAFRNRGDLTFEDVSRAWGFDRPGISQGVALADLDNDGDQDVVINNVNRAAFLLRNDSPAPRLAIRLQGVPPNTQGVGARITVLGGPVPQSHEIRSGGRYLSSDDTLWTFAAGHATNRLDVEVWWRSGRRSVVRGIPANHLCELSEASAPLTPRPTPTQPQPWFEDVSARLAHEHRDAPFNDFERQPLLPRKLSTAGPGLAWFDWDNDGWEDLLVGGGREGRLALLRSDGHGGFSPVPASMTADRLSRDQAGVLGWHATPEQPSLLIAHSSYEDPVPTGSAVAELDPATFVTGGLLPASASSAGPLALGDIDGDGDLDLFVGARAVAGRYPEAPASSFLRNEDGRLVSDAAFSASIAPAGMVSGAVWSDLDGDGRQELVLACDWGPVRVFRMQPHGALESTAALGLAAWPGWWNGVTTGDFDGDGRLDIVASNWGRNHKYARFAPATLHLYHGNLQGALGGALLEAYRDPETDRIVPWRTWDVVSRALPWVSDVAQGFHAFGHMSIDELLQGRRAGVERLDASCLDSMVFLNRGDRFEARPLPPEAQLAPAFGLSVADFDGDGCEDLFLAQNFFGNEIETPRMDAGRGLWLRGKGDGTFIPVPGDAAGILIYGEQRGSAVADFDQDGRPDLAVAQQGGPTRLFRNFRGNPGLRIRLDAGPRNPSGVGAVLRLISTQRSGPVREVHAGSGYWSQDAAVQVMAMPAGPAQLWVRWPGGITAIHPVPTGARDIKVLASGSLHRLQ